MSSLQLRVVPTGLHLRSSPVVRDDNKLIVLNQGQKIQCSGFRRHTALGRYPFLGTKEAVHGNTRRTSNNQSSDKNVR